MKLTITSVELKNPFTFFFFANYARKNVGQLKSSPAVKFKSTGIWTRHYTMSLWNNEEDLKTYARTGHHKESMSRSAKMCKEIRTLTIDRDEMPSWKEAKAMLMEQGKVLTF